MNKNIPIYKRRKENHIDKILLAVKTVFTRLEKQIYMV